MSWDDRPTTIGLSPDYWKPRTPPLATRKDIAVERLREALEDFGKRLAEAGYGWEAIITREDPSGETMVAHLTTANPEPEWDVAGLDVERLKTALAAVVSSPESLRRLRPSPDAFHTTARLIAAEYERLRSQESQKPPETVSNYTGEGSLRANPDGTVTLASEPPETEDR